jgi:RNA polymerase sigma-70 factor, ECF subfamily
MPIRVTERGPLALWSAPSLEAAGENPDTLERVVVDLFEQFRDPILRYLSALGLAHADGEEIVQEVFLLLCNHFRRGRPRHNLRGWLFRVAHNLALKSRHRTSRENETRADLDAPDDLIDPGLSPEAMLAVTQSNRRLQMVVEALPQQDRRCLILRAEGLRYREIAEVLDISLGAVSLSLARSLARIARAVER